MEPPPSAGSGGLSMYAASVVSSAQPAVERLSTHSLPLEITPSRSCGRSSTRRTTRKPTDAAQRATPSKVASRADSSARSVWLVCRGFASGVGRGRAGAWPFARKICTTSVDAFAYVALSAASRQGPARLPSSRKLLLSPRPRSSSAGGNVIVFTPWRKPALASADTVASRVPSSADATIANEDPQSDAVVLSSSWFRLSVSCPPGRARRALKALKPKR
mmetsp:Transcript_17013/g.54244  ORF Transcript_17013/g.54244 Transcript_17013/m.54244 type:complete len:219 (+) Transcript_17013:544-1200(+)